MKHRILSFDVMLSGRFVCTMHIPVTPSMLDGVDAQGRPCIDSKQLIRHIEARRPTLKGKPYNIIFN